MPDFLDKPIFYYGVENFITLKQILIVIMLILSAWLFSRFTSKILVGKLLNRTKMSKDSIAVIQRIIFFSLLVIITLVILSFLKIPLTNFALLSGAIGIGVGFGAKSIIENFLSGWILMTERPIRIGDTVELDSRFGKVISINYRATVIKRQDGAHMAIPNSQILDSKLINLTIQDPFIRTFIKVGVSYGTDVNLVKELLTNIANEYELISKSPGPLVVFEDFGDSALIFDLYFWVSIVSEKEFREIRSDIRFEVAKVFAQHNIVIAFPQRDVHHYIDDSFPKNIFNGKSK